jgi:hypothetical protein
MIMKLLISGHLGIACTQLQRQARAADSCQQQQQQQQQQEVVQPTDQQQQGRTSEAYMASLDDLQQQQQHITQFCTFEVPSNFLQTFQCDIILPPAAADIEAALQQCVTTATAAAAVAAPGSSQPANHSSSSSSGLQPVVPLLPAQHVSLMAAAAMPELVKQQQLQQRQQHGGDAAGEAGRPEAVSRDGDSADDDGAAAAGLTFWQLHIGLTAAGLAAYTAYTADEEDRHFSSSSYHIQGLYKWLVPHWLRDPMPPQQHCNGRRSSSSSGSSSGGFDAAELYGAVKPRGDEPMLQQQPPELLPRLRPYQRRAAAWMLAREGAQQQEQQFAGKLEAASLQEEKGCSNGLAALVQQQLHPLWRCALLLPPPAGAAVQQAAASSSSSSLDRSPVNMQDSTAHGLASGADGSVNTAAGVLYFCIHTMKLSLKAFEAPSVSGGAIFCHVIHQSQQQASLSTLDFPAEAAVQFVSGGGVQCWLFPACTICSLISIRSVFLMPCAGCVATHPCVCTFAAIYINTICLLLTDVVLFSFSIKHEHSLHILYVLDFTKTTCVCSAACRHSCG